MGAMGERQISGRDDEALRLKRQRMRSVVIAVSLFLLVVLFYAATIVHLGGNVMNRPL
jgi:hypothetical protein